MSSTATEAMTADGYPVMLDLRGRRCVVIGAGATAVSEIRRLVAAGATVEVVAPSVHPDILELDGPVFLRRRRYRPWDLGGAHLVIACTGDPTVDARVAAEAHERRIWVQAQSDPATGSFRHAFEALQPSLRS
ncbi:MAG: NAD(P)-dependent oxidoreductase [Actinomycetota bacterium]